MKLRKWNYQTKEYEAFEVPNEYKCSTFCADIDEIVTCPSCGKNLPYGDTYASLEFHTTHGIGYAVCEACYSEERKRKYKK